MYAYISNHFKLSSADFYYSLMANTYEANKEIQKSLMNILHDFFEAHFSGYRVLNASFLAKPAKTKNEFLLHQDWCYTDEKNYSAYNIWIPLTDVTADNGAMFFLPGSHQWFDNFRSGSLHTARITSAGALKPSITTVPLKKGQVLLFNPAVFHGSHPNMSNQNRLIITSTILPAAAPFLYFQKSDQESEITVCDLDENIFLKDLEKLAFGGKPSASEIKRLKYDHKMITEADLMAKLTKFGTR